MRASILHLSSKELFMPVQTELMTLCFSRVRGRVTGWVCADATVGDAVNGIAATGAAAMPSKKFLRFMWGTIPTRVALYNSVKVSRGRYGMGNGNRFQMRGFNVNHVIDILEGTADEQEFALSDDEAILVQDIGCDDDIRNSRFIFETEEDKAFCCSGALPRNDTAGDAHVSSVRRTGQVDGAQHAAAIHIGPAIGHGMRAGGHAGPIE